METHELLEEDEVTTYRDEFWNRVCTATPALIYLLVLLFLLLLLTMITLLFGKPDTASYAIAKVNFALGVTTMVASGYLLFRCTRRM